MCVPVGDPRHNGCAEERVVRSEFIQMTRDHYHFSNIRLSPISLAGAGDPSVDVNKTAHPGSSDFTLRFPNSEKNSTGQNRPGFFKIGIAFSIKAGLPKSGTSFE
jgi:hypothetical protein